MRVFLCIEPSKEAVSELTRDVSEIKKSELIKAKYVEPENLHLTLKFFGEVSENKVEEIKKKLEKFKFEKFETELENIGYFSERFIRVLWVGLECNNLRRLVEEIEKVFGKNDKETSCHLTLARVKSIKDKTKLKEFIKNFKIKKVKFFVDRIVLKNSVLTEKGPIYSNIFEKKLY